MVFFLQIMGSKRFLQKLCRPSPNIINYRYDLWLWLLCLWILAKYHARYHNIPNWYNYYICDFSFQLK